MSSNFIIPLVIYPYDVMFSIGQSDYELENNLKNFGLNIIDELKLPTSTKARTYQTESNQTIIRLREEYSFGILAHEVFHAVSLILNQIGMPLEVFVSDEAYAYLIQYIIEQFELKTNLIHATTQ